MVGASVNGKHGLVK